MDTRNVSILKVIKYGGAIVAYLAGAGFATGQEALQFFSAYGWQGALGACLLSLFFYLWFSYTVMQDGYLLSQKNHSSFDGLEYYCGKRLGFIFKLYTSIFMFLVVVIMISAAGSIFFEYYKMNVWWGRLLLTISSVIVVVLGMNNVVNLVSRIAYLLIIFAITISSINIIDHWDAITASTLFLENHELAKAAPTWYISGIIFSSMGGILLTPFLMRLGSISNSSKEASMAGIVGSCAFLISVGVMAYTILASIDQVYNKNIPMLVIAQNKVGGISILFSVILLLAVLSTAIPMLWLSSNAVVKNEKSIKFKMTVIIFGIIALIGSNFSFKSLINVLYPISGYFGLVLFVLIFIKKRVKKL